MKFLKINPGEGGKVLIFFILAALIQAGVILGVSIADGLYLTKLGVEKLPQAFLGMPVMMLVAVPIFGYLLNKIGIHRLLSLTFVMLIIGGIAFGGWLQVSQGEGFWVIYLLKLYSYLWFIITYTLYWNFVGEYFYLLDAKRLYPILSGGLTLGGIFGGYIVGYFGRIIPAHYILICWAVLVVFSFIVFGIISTTCRKVTEEDFSEANYTIASFADNLKSIFSNRFAVIISVVFFAGVVLAGLGEYQYSAVFSSHYTSEVELIGFFGFMFAVASGINFFVNFFVFSRLVHLMGVRNVAFIYPISLLIAFGIFSLHESYETALVLFFVIQSVLISIDLNNWNFIYKAFATSLQKTLRLFTESIIDPLATSIAGLFLITAGVFSLTSIQISMLALGVCFIHILFAFVLKSNYLSAVVEALRGDGFEFSKDLSVIAKTLPAKDVSLVEKSIWEEGAVLVFFYFNILWHSNKERAVKALLKRFEKKSVKNSKIFEDIFDTIFAYRSDYDLIKIIISWVKKNYHKSPVYLVDQLVRHNYLNYSEIPYRSEGAVNALRMAYFISTWSSSPDIGDSLEVLDELDKMIESNEEDDILNAIEILGHIGEKKYLDLLENYLDHPSPTVREQAIKSVAKLVDETSDRILPKLIERFPLEKKQTQLKLLNSISFIKDASVSRKLLEIGEAMSPIERREIFRTVCNFGLKAVPVVIATLNDDECSLVTRSLAARVLSYLAFPQLESLSTKIIDVQINKAYELLHMRAVLIDYQDRSTPSLSLLSRFYREMHEEEVNYVLEILALSGQIPDFELLKTSLRSDNLQIKGNAIEALEQGIPRSIFRRLLPLIDSRPVKAKIDFYLTRILDKNESRKKRNIIFDQIIEMTLQGNYRTGIAIALQIIWEDNEARFDQQIEKILKSPSEYLDGKQNILIEVVNSLFERDNRKIEVYNVVERLAIMIKNRFWKGATIENLLPIAHSAIEVKADKLKLSDKKDKANSFYLVMDGEITYKLADIEKTVGLGDAIGKGKSFFEAVNYTITKDKGAKLLKFDKEGLMRLAESSPELGLLILKDVI